jgi:hypothetical protein
MLPPAKRQVSLSDFFKPAADPGAGAALTLY